MTASTPSPPPGSDVSVREALDALERGDIVGLPTETVYGLGARADSHEAMERLLQLTGRQDAGTSGAQFSVHLGSHSPFGTGPGADSSGSRSALDLAQPQGTTQRLMDRYWPGPLTLVLPGIAEGDEPATWRAVRRPAHALCAELLDAAPFPIAIAAADTSGDSSASTAADLQDTYGDKIALVLDGGKAALGAPSTVLAIGPGRFEVLREGIITAAELRRAAGLSILFVCTGNTCRSPMAEGIARAALQDALGTGLTRWQTGLDETSFGFQVASAGVYAGAGSPAAENAVQALADRGIDLEGHRSQPALDQLVADADHVFCLTRSHRDALVAALPPGRAESVQLLDPEGRDVPDPFGGPLEVYRATADAIEDFIRARLPQWI